MIKFIIGLIAIIFIALMTYLYNENNSQEVNIPLTEKRVAKKVITQKKDIPTVSVVKKKIPQVTIQNKIVEDDLKVMHSNIGKDMTLNEIKHMNISENSKEILIDDLVYQEGLTKKPSSSLNKDQILKLIIEDLK